MTIEIPEIFRPCSTCTDDTCIFCGDKDTHEICVDYKDKRLNETIKKMEKFKEDVANTKDLYALSCVEYCIAILKGNMEGKE